MPARRSIRLRRSGALLFALLTPLLMAADEPAKVETRPISSKFRAAIQERDRLLIELVAEEFGVTLEHDARSIEWLARFIEKERRDLDQEETEGYVHVIGSFLGETLVAVYGGRMGQIVLHGDAVDSGRFLGTEYAAVLDRIPDPVAQPGQLGGLSQPVLALPEGLEILDGEGIRVVVLNSGADGSGPPCLIDRDGLAARRYDAKPGSWYLFRPDQHLAARGRRLRPATVLAARNLALGRDRAAADSGAMGVA